MNIYYCPKCGSEDVEIVCLNPFAPERVSIDMLADETLCLSVPAVLKVHKYRAMCKKCGYKREFIR